MPCWEQRSEGRKAWGHAENQRKNVEGKQTAGAQSRGRNVLDVSELDHSVTWIGWAMGAKIEKGTGNEILGALCVSPWTLNVIRSDMRSLWRTWGRAMTSSDLGSKGITEDAGWKWVRGNQAGVSSAQRSVEPYSCLCLEEGWWWKCVGDAYACGEKCLQSVCLFKVELSGLPDLSRTIKWDQAHENVPWALGCQKSHLLCLFIWWGPNPLRNHVWSLQTYFY